MDTLGDQLRANREAKALSVRKAAHMADMAEAHYRKIEAGQRAGQIVRRRLVDCGLLTAKQGWLPAAHETTADHGPEAA